MASGTLRRRRRAWLVALAAVSVVGTTAAPAAAYSLDPTTDAPVTLDGDTHWWNGPQILTNGNYQYSAYWDAADVTTGENYVKLTRRNLTTNALEHLRFDGTGGLSDQHMVHTGDGHNAVAIGLSPNDGRIHVSWSDHNTPHQYGISTARCLSEARLSTCRFTWSDHQADRDDESRFTYPYYFNDKRGRLYMDFRYGRSQEGNLFINRYNDAGGWSQVGLVVQGRDGGSYDMDGRWTDTDRDGVPEDGEPGWISAATYRGTNIFGFEFDNNDRLHFMWAYRERHPELGNGFNQHGVEYAYSDDYGVTWYSSAGTRIARTDPDPGVRDPITILDRADTNVVNFPYGTYPLGWDLKLDPMGQPHLVFPSSTVQTRDELLTNRRQTHVWRTATGRWYSSYITTEGGTWPGFGNLMFDRAGGAYYTYNRDDIGWAPYNDNEPREYSFDELPFGNVTVQGAEYLNIVPYSSVTALNTTEYLGIPIATGSSRDNRKITVRLKNNTVGTDFQLFWTTAASPAYNSARGQSFTIRANRTGYDTYTFTVTDADWSGTLRALEIYPAGLGDVHGAGKDISIDYIRIHDDAGTNALAWEFRSGVRVMVSEASMNDNWGTWAAPFQFPGINDLYTDATFLFDEQLYRDRKVVSFVTNEQGLPGTESVVVHNVDILGDDMIFNRDFAVDTQLFTAGTDVGSFAWASESGRGTVGGTITGGDSQIYSENNLQVPIETATRVRVILKNTSSAREAKLYFVTNASTSWRETQSVSIPITANSSYTTYTADISRAAGWRAGETLRQIRFDPANDASSGSFNLHDIDIYN